MTLLSNLRNSPRGVIALAIIAVLAINHLVGVIGLNLSSYKSLFETLTPINLVLSFLLVIVMHKPRNGAFYLAIVMVFILGMGVEAIGVNTGLPFGVYRYRNILGPMFCGVPFVIGLNWILLSYTCADLVSRLLNSRWQRVITASFAMVMIDLLLEKFAIKHHFWIWQNNSPPVINYVSWFAVSIVLEAIITEAVKKGTNPVAKHYFVVLLMFLIADFILSYKL